MELYEGISRGVRHRWHMGAFVPVEPSQEVAKTGSPAPPQQAEEYSPPSNYAKLEQEREDRRLAQAGFRPGERPTEDAIRQAKAMLADGKGDAAKLNKFALADKEGYQQMIAAGRFLGLVQF